jgi:hypothetical protein
MDSLDVFPECKIAGQGDMTRQFLIRKITSFKAACAYVHGMPYGYNTDRDDLLGLFKEGKGSCTTKHAVIATLAGELNLPVGKQIGIYAMTEALVNGTDTILNQFGLPYLPMVHCFLVHETHRVDLTEGNHNGKNGPIDHFLWTVDVAPNISAKKEYLLYRDGLRQRVLTRPEFADVPLKTVLQARQRGLALLKELI